MSKKEVSEQELLDWINNEFQKEEECQNVCVDGVQKLAKEDENGNNWELNVVRSNGVPLEVCMPIINDAKSRFNIKQ